MTATTAPEQIQKMAGTASPPEVRPVERYPEEEATVAIRDDGVKDMKGYVYGENVEEEDEGCVLYDSRCLGEMSLVHWECEENKMIMG